MLWQRMLDDRVDKLFSGLLPLFLSVTAAMVSA